MKRTASCGFLEEEGGKGGKKGKAKSLRRASLSLKENPEFEKVLTDLGSDNHDHVTKALEGLLGLAVKYPEFTEIKFRRIMLILETLLGQRRRNIVTKTVEVLGSLISVQKVGMTRNLGLVINMLINKTRDSQASYVRENILEVLTLLVQHTDAPECVHILEQFHGDKVVAVRVMVANVMAAAVFALKDRNQTSRLEKIENILKQLVSDANKEVRGAAQMGLEICNS